MLAIEGLGWKDIHVSLYDEASGQGPRFRNYLSIYVKRLALNKLRAVARLFAAR